MRFPPDESSPPEPVALEGMPFSHYYAQDTSDEGIMMETEVPVKQVSIQRRVALPTSNSV